MKNIAIIGAGMAGLSAASILSSKNYNIDIYERQENPGKKILLTGNGKCNLTNEYISEKCFISSAKDFYQRFLEGSNSQNILDFWFDLGIPVKSKNGYYYPVSGQAKTVTNRLKEISNKNNVNLYTDIYIKDIKITNNSFSINNKTYDFCIMACGGMSGIYRENEFNGFKILKSLNLKVNRLYPALTRIMVKNNNFKLLSGVRLDAELKLSINNNFINESEGEVQFTDKALSGISVFQLSVNLGKYLDKKSDYYSDDIKIVADFLPKLSGEDIHKLISNIYNSSNDNLISCISSFTNYKMAEYLLAENSMNKDLKIKETTIDIIYGLIMQLKNLTFIVDSLDSFKNSQVSSGGLSLEEIDNNYQVKNIKGLYVIGEMLDITGICGGYNLHFAVTSAIKATEGIINASN